MHSFARRPGAIAVTVDILEILEEPTIPKGVTKPQDSIMPKLQVLKFEDYDTWKQDMSKDQFMVVKVGKLLNADVVSIMKYACDWSNQVY